jgi:hypothetical protein
MKWQRCTLTGQRKDVTEMGRKEIGEWCIVKRGGGGGEVVQGRKLELLIAGVPWSGMGVVADNGCSVITLFS